jgi:hypothetical protein
MIAGVFNNPRAFEAINCRFWLTWNNREEGMSVVKFMLLVFVCSGPP